MGVLPQEASPPKNLSTCPLKYLAWIASLPQRLQPQVIHRAPPCSVKKQTEKVGARGGAPRTLGRRVSQQLPGPPTPLGGQVAAAITGHHARKAAGSLLGGPRLGTPPAVRPRQTVLADPCAVPLCSEPLSPTADGRPRPGLRSLLPGRLAVPQRLLLGHRLLPGPDHHRPGPHDAAPAERRLPPAELRPRLHEAPQAGPRYPGCPPGERPPTPHPPSSRAELSAGPRPASVIVCSGGLLGSLAFASRAGSYLVSLVDDHLVPLTLVVVVAFQNMALVCIYGARRAREEISMELGCQLPHRLTFLWGYVTLPGLLALLSVCLIQLHQPGAATYVAWNSSSSQEARQPYPRSTLGWATCLSLLALLPLPLRPLYHWWNHQDPAVADACNKPLSKKPALSPKPKPLPWAKLQGDSLSQGSQDKIYESSSFSLPLVTSAFSMVSSNLALSRQASPALPAAESSSGQQAEAPEGAEEAPAQ
uniref:Uncharacterized protein n=1 Tax=Oryctolagus cuniculus TaxID=9986 RepID=A0A5F9D4Z0_RABIT